MDSIKFHSDGGGMIVKSHFQGRHGIKSVYDICEELSSRLEATQYSCAFEILSND